MGHVGPAFSHPIHAEGDQEHGNFQFGGSPPSQESAIHVYAAGTFPTPGGLQASVVNPHLVDGAVNEFRHLDPPLNNVALQVPVSAGQTFVVAIVVLTRSCRTSPNRARTRIWTGTGRPTRWQGNWAATWRFLPPREAFTTSE